MREHLPKRHLPFHPKPRWALRVRRNSTIIRGIFALRRMKMLLLPFNLKHTVCLIRIRRIHRHFDRKRPSFRLVQIRKQAKLRIVRRRHKSESERRKNVHERLKRKSVMRPRELMMNGTAGILTRYETHNQPPLTELGSSGAGTLRAGADFLAGRPGAKTRNSGIPKSRK